MFKVIDKETKEVINVYGVFNDYSNPQFLYYDHSLKIWKWIQADWTEPYREDYFIVEDKPYNNSGTAIRGIITVTDKTTGKSRHKEWKTYEDGFNDREYVIKMLKDILYKEQREEIAIGKCN